MVDYGIGIVHREKIMVTLQEFLRNGQKIGRIFFKKMSEKDAFPLSYDIENTDPLNFLIAR